MPFKNSSIGVIWEKSSQYSYSSCLNLAYHRQVSFCDNNFIFQSYEIVPKSNLEILIKSAKIGMQAMSLLVI